MGPYRQLHQIFNWPQGTYVLYATTPNPVEASLLAKADWHPALLSTDTLLSRAGSLSQGFSVFRAAKNNRDLRPVPAATGSACSMARRPHRRSGTSGVRHARAGCPGAWSG